MSLALTTASAATLELADIVLSPTRYIASWLRQRGWKLPENRHAPPHALHTAQFPGKQTAFVLSMHPQQLGLSTVPSSQRHCLPSTLVLSQARTDTHTDVTPFKQRIPDSERLTFASNRLPVPNMIADLDKAPKERGASQCGVWHFLDA